MGESAYTKVSIFGEEYRIAGDDPEISVPELAAYVHGKMNDVKGHTKTFDTKRIAVLTALNLADELFREQARTAALVKQIKERTEEFDQLLELTLVDE